MAPTLGVTPDQIAALSRPIGVAIGSRAAKMRRSARSARAVIPLINRPLIDFIYRRCAPYVHGAVAASSRRAAPALFFEAYFSNFIEGTEFNVDDAARIVLDGERPPNRPADAHDILGTYRLLSDDRHTHEVGDDADDLVELVRRGNAMIMEGRPNKRAGVIKELANRAGATLFVAPDLVEGTLRAGCDLRRDLDTAWERAVLIAFVVGEALAFDDPDGAERLLIRPRSWIADVPRSARDFE